MRPIRGLFVDDEDEARRRQWKENLALALRDECDVDVSWDEALSVEEARRRLPRGQSTYQIVVVDLLWASGMAGPVTQDSRGLEIVEQAALDPSVAIIAFSTGDSVGFPELPEQAKRAGAHAFTYRSAISARERVGGWNRLARDVQGVLAGNSGARHTELFIVSGRNVPLVNSVRDWLASLKLHAYSWEELVDRTIDDMRGSGSPYIFDVVEHGFRIADGAIVLFSPDDEVRLKKTYWIPSTPAYDKQLTGQPRPNVLLEAGYALSHDRSHTIVVSVGDIRPVSDLGGMHILSLDNTAKTRKAFAERLRAMGFAVDMTGEDWLRVGRFVV